MKAAAEVGVKHYVLKPPNQLDLLEKVERILSGQDKDYLHLP
jgi:YesN/AraC family two-component response regulator